MKITLNVEQQDGQTYQVSTNLYSIVALERKYKIRASDLASGVAMEHLAFLAYEGAKQNNITVPINFDDYIRGLASVDVLGEDEPTNPTGEAVTSEVFAS